MQRPALARPSTSSPLTILDSDDEEGPFVEGFSIFENSTDSSSSEATLGLDCPQSPVWEDRLESFLRRRRRSVSGESGEATPTKKARKALKQPKAVMPAAARAAPAAPRRVPPAPASA
jgi:hypothetical protein